MANRGNRHNIVIALACITLGANPFGVIARFFSGANDIVSKLIGGEVVWIGFT